MVVRSAPGQPRRHNHTRRPIDLKAVLRAHVVGKTIETRSTQLPHPDSRVDNVSSLWVPRGATAPRGETGSPVTSCACALGGIRRSPRYCKPDGTATCHCAHAWEGGGTPDDGEPEDRPSAITGVSPGVWARADRVIRTAVRCGSTLFAATAVAGVPSSSWCPKTDEPRTSPRIDCVLRGRLSCISNRAPLRIFVDLPAQA